MRIDDFGLLAFFPPRKGLILISALSFEQVLYNKLLVLVPPHFEWLFIDVNKVVDLFVVDLQERYVDFIAEAGVGLGLVLDRPEEVEYASGYEPFIAASVSPFNRISLARPRLPIREYRRMIPIDNAIDQPHHVDGIINLFLCALISEDVVKLEDFFSFFCQFYTTLAGPCT